jgi:hypothetical protein
MPSMPFTTRALKYSKIEEPTNFILFIPTFKILLHLMLRKFIVITILARCKVLFSWRWTQWFRPYTQNNQSFGYA